MNKKTYEFGEFTLDLNEKRLLKNGQTVSLQPKVFDMLAVFVEKNGELLSRDELMKAVWKDTFVEETNLRFCIHSLRKSLGKTSDGKDYVETVPKRGYRFAAEINEKTSQIDTGKAEEKTDEVALAQAIEKPSKRNWLIGIAAFSAICVVIFFIAWQKNKTPIAENALGINQLAVLPLASANETGNDFQIGLTDAMITNLSKIKRLKVVPLAAVRRFAGVNYDAANAGKELGADTVLSGTYRADADNIRVLLSLSRVANSENLWTETFELKNTNGFELENTIAVRAARRLSLKIADAEDERQIKSQRNLNAEVAQNYLSARKIWRGSELFRREEMIGLFEKIIQAEPNWALAFSSYAEALIASDQSFAEWEKAEQIARRAIELDDSLAAPHAVLAEIYAERDWNWEAAEDEFKKAIALDGENASAHSNYSDLLKLERRFAEAEEELRKAIEIEPFSPLFHASFGELYAAERKFEKALASCHYARQIEPDFWMTPKMLFQIYIEKKMYAELEEMILGRLSPAEKSAHPLTKSLAENDLRFYFRSIVDTPSKSGREILTPNAVFFVRLGENEKALENLEKALARRDPLLPQINADSTFDSIRGEKRFVEIMRKVGLQK